MWRRSLTSNGSSRSSAMAVACFKPLPSSGGAFRLQRLSDLRSRLAAEFRADGAAGSGNSVKINAVRDAKTVEQVEYVLRADVPRRPSGIGAAAQPGNGRIEHGNATLHHGHDIGERLAIGVVEMGGELFPRHLRRNRLDHGHALRRRANADRVAERDLVAAHSK